MSGGRVRRTLQVAEEVHRVLLSHGIETAIIGAVALAAHNYPRSTEDIDFAADTDPFTKLKAAKAALEGLGFEVRLNLPDAEDPLGGVLTVSGNDFDSVQVVNYYNPFSGGNPLATEALQHTESLAPGSPLKVVDLPHLIALKLYAGGEKSRLDVLELIERNQPLDIDAIRTLCGRFGLQDELDSIVSSAKLR